MNSLAKLALLLAGLAVVITCSAEAFTEPAPQNASAAATIAAAQFGMAGLAGAQGAKPADLPAVKPGTNTR